MNKKNIIIAIATLLIITLICFVWYFMQNEQPFVNVPVGQESNNLVENETETQGPENVTPVEDFQSEEAQLEEQQRLDAQIQADFAADISVNPVVTPEQQAQARQDALEYPDQPVPADDEDLSKETTE